jgi:hypothetical protein
VPAEAARLERRIGRRDRRFFAVLACAAVIGAPAIVLVARHHTASPASRSDAACIDAPHAGVLGGGAYHYCGAAAIAFCQRFAADDAVAAKCEELGRPAAGRATRASATVASATVSSRLAATSGSK